MEKLIELNKEELEILLEDCQGEISRYKSRLIDLIIEKDFVRNRLRQLEEEKDILELVKSGSDFNEHLVSAKPFTMSILQKRYLNIIQNEFRDSIQKECP